MADFKTHLSVAGTLSGVLATGCLQMGLIEPRDALLVFGMGTIGGILPDIDSDHSIPVNILFSCLATLAAFFSVFGRIGTYSIAEAILLWVAVFVIVRYLVFELFKRFTVHRGVFHSLLAAVFFCFLSATLLHDIFALPSVLAWLSGCFIVFGYLIHLLLDELYSVDMLGGSPEEVLWHSAETAQFHVSEGLHRAHHRHARPVFLRAGTGEFHPEGKRCQAVRRPQAKLAAAGRMVRILRAQFRKRWQSMAYFFTL